MRTWLYNVAALALLLAAAPAFAQEAEQDNEFAAFRNKLSEVRDSSATAATPAPSATPASPAAPVTPSVAAAPAAPAPASPLVVPVAEAPPSAGPSPAQQPAGPSPAQVNAELNNLLGPAGALPLDPKSPAIPAPQTPQDLQAAMAAEQQEQARRIEQLTFDAALRQLLPMSPDQIRKTYEAFVTNREAAETPMVEPEAKQVVETISLDPSDAVTTIWSSPGYVTTVLFLDASGAPWPIEDMTWAGRFNIIAPTSGGNIIRITPQTAHGVGNISIKLVDLPAPITLNLKTGITQVYYRMDLRIPKQGPLAKTPLIEYGGLKSTAGKDEGITAILDGVPPPAAEQLTVNGVDGRTAAWKINDAVYLRTPLTLLSPGWRASASSADGMNVYALDRAPVVLLSDKGRMVQARIQTEGIAP